MLVALLCAGDSLPAVQRLTTALLRAAGVPLNALVAAQASVLITALGLMVSGILHAVWDTAPRPGQTAGRDPRQPESSKRAPARPLNTTELRLIYLTPFILLLPLNLRPWWPL